MRNITTRVTDGPNASRLPSASLSLNGVSSDLRQTTGMMPTAAMVTDTDVDAYGYTLPGSESLRTSASASMVDRLQVTYLDMRNIPTRVTDGPSASGLPSASLSFNGISSDLRQTTGMMPTPAVVDADVDAHGYTLPRNESVRTSASASIVDQRRIDYDIDENGYKIARKCEESDYAELI